MLIIGSHCSIARGFLAAAKETAEEYGGNALQLFLKNPRGRGERKLEPHEPEEFRAYCRKNKIKFISAHSSYLLNFAKPLKDEPWMLPDIAGDFKKLQLLGGHGIVLHTGKHKKLPYAQALKFLLENLKRIMHETHKTGVELYLENLAGQGTEMGWRFPEWAEIYHAAKKISPRIRLCLDTAHAWAAGYHLSTEEQVKDFFRVFEKMFGRSALAMIHLNETKKLCGSRADRHANIGEGAIGNRGMRSIVKFAIRHSIPLILETPGDENWSHQGEFAKIRKLLSEKRK